MNGSGRTHGRIADPRLSSVIEGPEPRPGTRMRLPAPISLLAAAVSCLPGALARAQESGCQPRWSPTFDGIPGVNGVVYAMTVFDDGHGPALYVGGDFVSAGGVPARNVARWDGERWSALGSGLGGDHFFVQALAVYDDGRGPALYAGGYFPNSGFLPVNNIARWTGSVWLQVGSGINNGLTSLAVYDDGGGPALYAGGFFLSSDRTSTPYIAKWNGTRWVSLGSGMSDFVYSLTVFDDGRGPALYAGGGFTVAGGISANRVARWNGSSWSRVGNGLNERVAALRVFDDGSGPALYAGGAFDRSGQLVVNRVAKWNGASWSALGENLSSSRVPAPHAEALTVYDDGSGPALYVTGNFTRAGGATVNHVAKWNGSAWSGLAGGFSLSGGTLGAGFSLGVFDGGAGPELYAGGLLTKAGGGRAFGLARWDGTAWSPPGRGANDEVAALAVIAGPRGSPALYAGGAFTHLGGRLVNRVAGWSGGEWTSLGAGMDDAVQALALFDPDGAGAALHAGGAFTRAGALAANHVARWDGKGWAPLGAGTDGPVRTLETFDDGAGAALFAGGAFAAAGGAPANGIARWDGAGWTPLASGLLGAVSDLAVFDDGRGPALFAGGEFETTGELVVVNHVARWDGAAWAPLGGGVNDAVRALAVFDDRSGRGPALYAGGSFTSASGVAASRVARWDGTSWTPLASGLDQALETLGVFDDGGGPALYAGGLFTLAGDAPAAHLARWNGASWSPLGGGLSGSVRALAVLDDPGRGGPSLLAGGAFTSALDSLDGFLARWRSCPDATPPVLACPSSITVTDPLAGPPGEIVTFSVTASDARDPFPYVVCEPPSGSLFPPGVTLVQCKATDAARNQSSCSFPVTVRRKQGK
jgi:hypothetical protein